MTSVSLLLFKERFNVRMGRPTTAVATYLCLMYLKYRYGLGYEVLVKEVSNSPTLIKLTHKYGADTVSSLNDTLILKLKESKLIRGRKLRIGITVVESDIHHPTDVGQRRDEHIGRPERIHPKSLAGRPDNLRYRMNQVIWDIKTRRT